MSALAGTIPFGTIHRMRGSPFLSAILQALFQIGVMCFTICLQAKSLYIGDPKHSIAVGITTWTLRRIIVGRNSSPIMVTFLALTWVSVVLRCFVRIRITKSFEADDWLMATSLVIFTLYGGFVFAGVHYGMGKHNDSLPQDQEIHALKYQALATAIYIANMAFIKLSIAVFLLRIAVQQRYQLILKISIAIVAVWTAGVFFFDVFECKPVEFQWDYTIKGGTCVPGDSLVSAGYAFSVLSVLSDWLYALLPIPMLWNVKMSLNTKIIVVVILSLGIFASIATLIRIKYLIELASSEDILYASTDTMIWTIIEPGLGITAASVVTLRPLLRALKIRGFTSDNDGGPYHHNGTGVGGPYARGGQDSGPDIPGDSEALNEFDVNSHRMDLLRASSGALTTNTVSTGKKVASVSMRTYSRSDNESQEIILGPVDSRSESRVGLHSHHLGGE